MPAASQGGPASDSRALLERAAGLLASGEWQAAHTLVQSQDSPLAAWLHGIAHLLEGDADNARYWYERAQRPFPEAGAAAVAGEVQRVRSQLADAAS